MDLLIFKEDEIRQFVTINKEAIQVVENAFTSLAAGDVQMPPIMSVDIPENHGEIDVKTAYIRGLDKFCIKISAGFFENYKKGLPSGNGMMLLISTETGIPQSVLLDNGYLTDVRTAAAGAIAAKYLAVQQLETVGVIGSGAQARYQMIALKLVRNFSKILVYGPTPERVEEFVVTMKRQLDVEVVVCQSPEEVVRGSQLVVTTTPSKTPIIKAEWLHPGLHITAMGSDAESKQELAAEVLSHADLLVCDVISQCFRLGELHHGIQQGKIQLASPIVELGELTSGKISGRTDNNQITVCDLTGTGVQDTAIATFAYNELVSSGLGIRL
jgi:ectoine utilization protein EutC